MGLSGRSFDPTGTPPRVPAPVVDYRLARRSALAGLRRGFLATTDVCDAHPELLRAAKNIGEDATVPCPVCSHETLRLVRYVFGEELRGLSGRVVYPHDWLRELVQSYDSFTCYTVEVCTDCHWNHLIRAFQAGKRYATARTLRERRPRR
ncbi:MAG TPA: DUF5318 family protein [Actinomycetota bacterium]|jgi:hypothetical protein|nr:DUF5318 family protein [Actinomycetota bacterium]